MVEIRERMEVEAKEESDSRMSSQQEASAYLTTYYKVHWARGDDSSRFWFPFQISVAGLAPLLSSASNLLFSVLAMLMRGEGH